MNFYIVHSNFIFTFFILVGIFLLIFGQRKFCIASWRLVTIPVWEMTRNDTADARTSQFASALTFIVVKTE